MSARGLAGALGLACALTIGATAARAQGAPAATKGTSDAIYTCLDDQGRRLTSDRPIPECAAREQQQLNRDGSLKRVVPPALTAQEKAEREMRERKAAEERAARADATRQDRSLLQRYRTPEDHQRARETAMNALRGAMAATESRLESLGKERRQYADEEEFYRGRRLPPKLQQQIDSVEAALAAQRTASQNQRAELDRVNRLFDAELERLKLLWAGAAPGSLGPLLDRSGPASAASSAPARR